MERFFITKAASVCLLAFGWSLAGGGAVPAGTIQRPAAPGASPVDQGPLPDFGLDIDGTFDGRGILLTRIPKGGHAGRVGLEPGDVLLAVNECSVRTPADWEGVMTDNNGRFHLRVRDVRTGNIVYRDVDLRN
jgi:S1-C subfamily serine protease